MIASYATALRGYNRDVRTILIVSAISSFTMDGVFPVVFNLYILRLGFNAEFVGTVNAIGLLIFSIAALPAGSLGTRFGARAVMVTGVSMTMVSAFAIAATSFMPHNYQSIWITTAFSILYTGIALYWVNCSPALINLTPPAERSRVISMQSAFGNLLAFIGGPLAGLLPLAAVAIFGWTLAEPAPYGLPLLLAGVIYISALILIVRIKPVPNAAPARAGTTRGAPNAATGFISLVVFSSIFRFLIVAAIASTNTFFNVYMDESMGQTSGTIGIVVAIARLAAVFVALMVPVATERFGSGPTAIVASFASALVIIPMGLLPYWQVASAGYIGMQMASALRYASMYVYLMSITPSHQRTIMTGMGEFSGGLSFAFFAWVGGFVIVRLGYPWLYIGSAIITIAGSFMFWIFARWWAANHRGEISEPLIDVGVEPGGALEALVGVEALLEGGGMVETEQLLKAETA